MDIGHQTAGGCGKATQQGWAVETQRNSDKRAAGREAEAAACAYLANKGYRILYRNFRFGRYGEIDLIAKKSDVICFVEVKSRSGSRFGRPSEAVGYRKRQKILTVAAHFQKISSLSNYKMRFDVVEVYYGRPVKTEADRPAEPAADRLVKPAADQLVKPASDRPSESASARAPREICHIENAFGAE